MGYLGISGRPAWGETGKFLEMTQLDIFLVNWGIGKLNSSEIWKMSYIIWIQLF